MTEKVNNILEYSAQVEQYEKERTEANREKILSRFAELKAEPDQSRLEQEMFMKSDIPNLIEPLSRSNLTKWSSSCQNILIKALILNEF